MESNNIAGIRKELHYLMNTNKPIILFGAKYAGSVVHESLKRHNKIPVCFCDNNVNKYGKSIKGIPINTPEKAYELYPDAIVIICLFNTRNEAAARHQLTDLGFTDILSKNCVLLQYIKDSKYREFLEEDALYLLSMLSQPSEDQFIMRDISVFISSKCSLKCKDCCTLMPYFKKTEFLSPKEILHGVISLLNGIDGLFCINIIGGEPFLHPELTEICKEISKIKNILMIRIATNGTVVPDIDYSVLRDSGVSVQISDYGLYSKKKDLLIHTLDKFQIPNCIAEDIGAWYQIHIGNNGLNPSELQEMYQSCYFRRQSTELIGDRYYGCCFAGSLGLIKPYPGMESDYVKVSNNPNVRDEVQKLDFQSHNLEACRYCGFHPQKQVSGYEQADSADSYCFDT